MIEIFPSVDSSLDRAVATQDGNQRSKNQWIFTKYDVQGRAVMTGIWDDGGTPIFCNKLFIYNYRIGCEKCGSPTLSITFRIYHFVQIFYQKVYQRAKLLF